jgi:hypothetical protein
MSMTERVTHASHPIEEGQSCKIIKLGYAAGLSKKSKKKKKTQTASQQGDELVKAALVIH